jgi:hypothetical protein
MCDDRFGLNILLHNPVTDEMLAVPTLPPTHRYSTMTSHHTYSFTHDQATGHYMVVHVPPNSFGRVLVFTYARGRFMAVGHHIYHVKKVIRAGRTT